MKNLKNNISNVIKNENQTAYFVDPDQALFWYMEEKRKKYAIKTSQYAEFEYDSSEKDRRKNLTISELLKWGGVLQFPKSKEESAMVVASLDKVFMKLEKRTKVILMLHYLGDFATDDLYKKACESQRILKDRGYKVIMFYKYPKTKVAKMLGVDRKTVTRHVQKAHKVFYEELKNKGFIFERKM